jgi:hypothetical protein
VRLLVNASTVPPLYFYTNMSLWDLGRTFVAYTRDLEANHQTYVGAQATNLSDTRPFR